MFNPGSLKTSFNSGEISPDAAGRIELKTYFSGASLMQRIEPVPQGGFDLMPGTRHIAYVRGALAQASAPALTVPGVSITAGGVIASLTLSAAADYVAADFSALSCPSAISARFEYRAGLSGAWTALPAFQIDSKARVYRACLAPGSAMGIRELRLVRVDAGAGAVVACGGTVSLKTESAASTDARYIPFHTSRTNSFDLVMTDGHCDVYKEDVFQCGFAVPFVAADLPALRWEQQSATLLLFHPDRATQKVLKQGDADWLTGDQIWSNVPKVDLGGVYTKTADKWRITVIGLQTASQWTNSSLELTIAGETSEAVSLDKIDLTNADRDAIAAAIQAKIIAMAGVETGVTVTAEPYTAAGNFLFTVEYAGTDNIGERFETSGRVYAPTACALNASRIQRADAGGEAIFSPSRGYARDGKFWAQRMILGGFKEPSVSTAILASVLSSYFDLNTEIVTADGATLIRPPASDGDVIERIVAGRHLMIFTQEAEYFIVDRTLSRTSVPNLVQSTRNGCAENVPVIVADNGVFYVNRSNSLVFKCAYNDVSQAYDSSPVSMLASHLTRNVIDAAYQRPTQATDAGRYFLVRSDGIVVVGSVVQEQEITGFVRWVTDGQVKRIGCDVQDRAKLIVSRTIAGQARLTFERMDETVFLDGVVQSAPASATVTGLAMHEGREVWAVADGHVLGPFTVTGGQITLDQPADSVLVGRWTAPDGLTLPASREIAPNTVMLRDGRITAVRLHVIDTTSIAIGANGQPAKDMTLYRMGMPADAPLPAYTGKLDAVALLGFTRGPQVQITQVRPGKLKVRDLVYELKG